MPLGFLTKMLLGVNLFRSDSGRDELKIVNREILSHVWENTRGPPPPRSFLEKVVKFLTKAIKQFWFVVVGLATALVLMAFKTRKQD